MVFVQADIYSGSAEVLLFPDKSWWAKRLDVAIIAQGGPGRGSTITNDFLVVRQHLFHAGLIAGRYVGRFSRIVCEVVKLNEGCILELLVILGIAAKYFDCLFPRVLGSWLRKELSGTATSRTKDQFPVTITKGIGTRPANHEVPAM